MSDVFTLQRLEMQEINSRRKRKAILEALDLQQ